MYQTDEFINKLIKIQSFFRKIIAKNHLSKLKKQAAIGEPQEIIQEEKEEYKENFTFQNGAKYTGIIMKDILKMEIGMDLDARFGLMVQNMKDIGKMERQMGKGSFGISMEIFMKENGLMIKLMDTENIYIRMGRHMKDHGRTIFRKGLVVLLGKETWEDGSK